MRELEEQGITGVMFENMPGGQAIHTMARDGRIPEARLNVDGAYDGPSEEWLVATRVRGVEVINDRTFAGVQFSNRCPVQPDDRSKVEGAPGLAGYLEGPIWATATVTASTAFDAYEAGVRAIRSSVSAMRLLGSHRYPRIRDDLRAFDRDATLVRIVIGPEFFARGLRTGRGWLHSSVILTKPPTLMLDSQAGDEGWDVAFARDPHLRRAVDEWRTSADSLDDLATVTHLWRSIECYAKAGQADELFDGKVLRAIRHRALDDSSLSKEQRDRIVNKLGEANSPPLLARLQAKLRTDGIALSKAEFDTLAHTRKLRNDLEHARQLTDIEYRQLEMASAIVNHVLCMAASVRT